jgi:hypothetical protein
VPRPRFEDRYTSGGQPLPARWNAAQERWEPVLGEERASGPQHTHAAMHVTHTHPHPDYQGGTHQHIHSHSGDSSHGPRAGHKHDPGSPDASMPSVGLASAGTGGETRARGRVPARQREDAGMGAGLEDLDLGLAIRAYLHSQGVNVDRALERAQTASQVRGQRARARAQAAGDVAIHWRRAKRHAEHEQRGWLEHAPGFTWAKVVEARERVAQLEAELREACLDDPQRIAEARRRAAR